MKTIRWEVTGTLAGPGPLVAFVLVGAGEPEAGDKIRCVETGKCYTVISMGLGLGPDAIAAGTRMVELDVATDEGGIEAGMTFEEEG